MKKFFLLIKIITLVIMSFLFSSCKVEVNEEVDRQSLCANPMVRSLYSNNYNLENYQICPPKNVFENVSYKMIKNKTWKRSCFMDEDNKQFYLEELYIFQESRFKLISLQYSDSKCREENKMTTNESSGNAWINSGNQLSLEFDDESKYPTNPVHLMIYKMVDDSSKIFIENMEYELVVQ